MSPVCPQFRGKLRRLKSDLRARIAAPQADDWSDYVYFRMASPPIRTPPKGIGAGTSLIRPRGVEGRETQETRKP